MTRAEQNARALATGHLMADLGRRTVRGSIVTMLAQAIRLALQLAGLAIMARLLAPEDFGVVAMAATVTAFVGLFTDLGLSAATVQRKEIDQNTVSALFFMNLAIGIVVMAVACAAAPVASWFFDDGRVAWVVVALAGIIPFAAAGAQHRALLARGMRWLTIQWTALAAQALGLVVGAGVAWTTDLGYWALVASAWASGILGLALLWMVSPWRPTRVENWRGARQALRFGLNLTGFNLVNFLNRRLDHLLIGWLWGPAALGLYSRAYQLLLVPIQQINGPIAAAVVPGLSRLQADPEAWRRMYLDALFGIVLLTAPIGMAMILFAGDLILVLLGEPWTDVTGIFRWLALSLLVQPILNSTGWLYLSLGRTDRMLRWALFATPVVVGAFFLGLPYGASGVALMYSAAIVALTLPCLAYAFHGTPLRLADAWTVAAPPFACAALAAGLATGILRLLEVQDLGAFWRLSAGLTVYGLCCAALLSSLPRTRQALRAILNARGSIDPRRSIAVVHGPGLQASVRS